VVSVVQILLHIGLRAIPVQVLRGVKNQEKHHEVHEEHEDKIRRSFHSRSVSYSHSFVLLKFDFFARREELFATE
jgi:hypothetical protein